MRPIMLMCKTSILALQLFLLNAFNGLEYIRALCTSKSLLNHYPCNRFTGCIISDSSSRRSDTSNFGSAEKRKLTSQFRGRSTGNTRLYSYGDPDLSEESALLRRWQQFARAFDRWLFPAEVDFPGLTFASPVEWAPWMETIWFGNYYDYRTGFFQDVMYSNNQPYKEGALLFDNTDQALQIALLYQRYKKFDSNSYAVSNATFFNVFGGESLRVGRYKIPLTDEVLLCTTDPLTYSETKRYLNSFNALKFFKSQFLQQKRKRQYPMRVLPRKKTIDDGSSSTSSSSSSSSKNSNSNRRSIPVLYSEEFFPCAVHTIEFDRTCSDPLVQEKYPAAAHDFPVIPIDLPAAECLVLNRQNITRLLVPVMVANSQYFMENLFQSILDVAAASSSGSSGGGSDKDTFSRRKSFNVYVGGDGRLLNSFATEQLLRVCAGNAVQRVVLMQRNALTSSSIRDYLEAVDVADGIGIVLTAGEERGGIQGYFGVDVYIPTATLTGTTSNMLATSVASSDDSSIISKSSTIHSTSNSKNLGFWIDVINRMRERRSVRMTAQRPPTSILDSLDNSFGISTSTSAAAKVQFLDTLVQLGSTAVIENSISDLMLEFDIDAVAAFLQQYDVLATYDALHCSSTVQYLKPLLQLLNSDVDSGSDIINSQTKSDFGGQIPAAVPAAAAAVSMQLFNSETTTTAEPVRRYAIDYTTTDTADILETESIGNGTSLAATSNTTSRFGNETAFMETVYYEEEATNITTANALEVDQLANTSDASDTNSATERRLEDTPADAAMINSTDDCPDIGFVISANMGHCMVLYPGGYVSEEETKVLLTLHSEMRRLLQNAETPVAENALQKDALYQLLCILDLWRLCHTHQQQLEAAASSSLSVENMVVTTALRRFFEIISPPEQQRRQQSLIPLSLLVKAAVFASKFDPSRDPDTL